MIKKIKYIFLLMIIGSLTACSQTPDSASAEGGVTRDKIVLNEEEWKTILDSFTYHILREKGTERAFTGKYWNNKEEGEYLCAGCGLSLFSSETKFDSGTRSEEHTSELQSRGHLVCRLLLEKKKCKSLDA